jgi:hypothetical protein
LKRPHSYPHFEEAVVGQRIKSFTVAFFVTILDIAVIWHDGPILWQVWGGIPWIRIALLVLAGTGAFTLADIWSRTLSGSSKRLQLKEMDGSETVGSLRSEALEGADV